jgi:hypothetical protein
MLLLHSSLSALFLVLRDARPLIFLGLFSATCLKHDLVLRVGVEDADDHDDGGDHDRVTPWHVQCLLHYPAAQWVESRAKSPK